MLFKGRDDKMSNSYIQEYNGKMQLIVDDEPFIILGMPWYGDLLTSKKEVNDYLSYLKKKGCNTVILRVKWRDIEPSLGMFTCDDLEQCMIVSSNHGLKLILCWVGGFDYSVCVLQQKEIYQDKKAFLWMIQHVNDFNQIKPTVIMIAVENDPQLLSRSRCHCTVCNQLYQEAGWKSESYYAMVCFVHYIDDLVKDAKSFISIPLYINLCIENRHSRPSDAQYFTKDKCRQLFYVFMNEATHIHFITHDALYYAADEFIKMSKKNKRQLNLLLITEQLYLGKTKMAKTHIFEVIGMYGAIGYMPIFMDDEGNWSVTLNGVWDANVAAYMTSLALLNDIMPILKESCMSKAYHTQSFYSEFGEESDYFALGNYSFLIDYTGSGRGLIIQLQDKEYLILGIGIRVAVCDRKTEQMVHSLHWEWGHYIEQTWHTKSQELIQCNFGYVTFRGPSVAKIIIE